MVDPEAPTEDPKSAPLDAVADAGSLVVAQPLEGREKT